jgi:P-type Ca2+ transporter type 2C
VEAPHAGPSQPPTLTIRPPSVPQTLRNTSLQDDTISSDRLFIQTDPEHSRLFTPSSTAYSYSPHSAVETSNKFSNVDYDRLLDTGAEEPELQRVNNPFAFTPKQLAKLHDPRNLDVLRAMSGVLGLAIGLQTNLEQGLSPDETILSSKVTLQDVRREVEELNLRRGVSNSAKEMDDPKAFMKADEDFHKPERRITEPHRDSIFSLKARSFTIRGHHSEPPFKDRRRVFSINRIPLRKPKNIFQLMWATLKDRILV